jgi:glycosyltransferase involved in cell wall biosynthesis
LLVVTEILKQNESFGDGPTVSVIITAYNAAPFISEALDSVLRQTFTNFEIIVVNDGSPDTAALEAALAPYLSRIVYLKQKNQGTGAARNTGIRAARAQFISLLDGDDLWEPEYLEAQLALLEKEPKPAVVYCDAVHFGVGDTVGRTFMDVCPSEGEVTFESLLTAQCTVLVSVMARVEAVISAGMFDEDRAIMGSDDFDLWLRIAKQGNRIVYQRRPLVRRRLWRGQLSSHLIFFFGSIIHVLEKVERDKTLTAHEKHLVKERQQHYRAMLELIKGKEALLKEDTKEAYVCLMKANQCLKRPKISLVLLALRLAPTLLYAFGIRKLVMSRSK